MRLIRGRRGKVRITGGEFRGRKIETPGGNTHPMGERERIALFNMIQEQIENSYVLDAYCGGGTLGIEALSRGAIFVSFVDKNEKAIATVNDNLKKLGLYGVRGATTVSSISATARTATDRYGVVIADPPYDKYEERMVKYLPRLVSEGGTLVLSHPGEPPELKGVKLVKTRKYAAAHISVYSKV